jgi:hypothetical protein
MDSTQRSQSDSTTCCTQAGAPLPSPALAVTKSSMPTAGRQCAGHSNHAEHALSGSTDHCVLPPDKGEGGAGACAVRPDALVGHGGLRHTFGCRFLSRARGPTRPCPESKLSAQEFDRWPKAFCRREGRNGWSDASSMFSSADLLRVAFAVIACLASAADSLWSSKSETGTVPTDHR